MMEPFLVPVAWQAGTARYCKVFFGMLFGLFFLEAHLYNDIRDTKMMGKVVGAGLVIAIAVWIAQMPRTSVSFQDSNLPATNLPPWPVFELIQHLSDVAAGFLAGAPPTVRVLGTIQNVVEAMMIPVMFRLEIPELLHSAGPNGLTCNELAAQIGKHHQKEVVWPDLLCRLTDTMVTARLLDKDASTDHLSLTELGQVIRRDHPLSMGAFADLYLNEAHVNSYRALSESIFNGRSGFQTVTGDEYWDHLENNDQIGAFGAGMQAMTRFSFPAFLADVSLEGVKTFCDIGGGVGTALASALQHYPDLTGTVFDLPAVKPLADDYLSSLGLAPKRAQFVGGSFFEPLPTNMQCDAYLLKYIMHDWSDDACVQILSHISHHMQAGARVYIMGMVQGNSNHGGLERAKQLLDTMMAGVSVPGARERTTREFEQLLGKAGLQRVDTVLLRDAGSVTVAEKA